MNNTVLASVAFCLAVAPIFFRRWINRMRIVKLDNIWDRILWSMRISRSTTAFPRNLAEWTIFVEDDPTRQFQPGWNAWMFLRPFFASRGYTLYEKLGDLFMSEPRPEPALARSHVLTYPYARTIPKDSQPELDNKYELFLKNASVWGARDALGRDVIIKIISDLDKPTNEWLVLQRLNDSELRQDPANRTIHVIEFIIFDNFVFVVMPRWDCAFEPPFKTVSELMEVTKAYLEALDFLHKHRIAHMDIRMHNCGMNMYAGTDARYATTLMRGSKDVQYILYDFGYSLLYPIHTDISTVSLERFLGYTHAPSPTGSYNPFKADVTMMGGLLFGFVMHGAATVPAIEPFFYRMMDLDEDKRLTASQALQEFLQIYATLSTAQLETPVNALWTNKFRTNLLPSLREMWLQRYGD